MHLFWIMLMVNKIHFYLDFLPFFIYYAYREMSQILIYGWYTLLSYKNILFWEPCYNIFFTILLEYSCMSYYIICKVLRIYSWKLLLYLFWEPCYNIFFTILLEYSCMSYYIICKVLRIYSWKLLLYLFWEPCYNIFFTILLEYSCMSYYIICKVLRIYSWKLLLYLFWEPCY
jgi:hypothetical protein